MQPGKPDRAGRTLPGGAGTAGQRPELREQRRAAALRVGGRYARLGRARRPRFLRTGGLAVRVRAGGLPGGSRNAGS